MGHRAPGEDLRGGPGFILLPPLSFQWTEAIRGPAPQELSRGLSINPNSECP